MHEIHSCLRHDPDYPDIFEQLNRPPSSIYYSGRPLADIMDRPRVAIVGTRSITPYGRQVTQDLVKQLVGRGVVIVSGLAYGVDAEAHQAAIDTGGITVAVLPSPVNAPAPAGNQRLARRILDSGGTLFSTYAADSESHKGNFVQRNEYVAALSQVVIIPEAGQRSGSRHTAVFAGNLGIPVFAVPGPITSKMSAGANGMIHSNLASIYNGIADVAEKLGLGRQTVASAVHGDTPGEQAIIDLMRKNVGDGQSLLARSGLDVSEYNRCLTMLEIAGKIRPLGGNQWSLA